TVYKVIVICFNIFYAVDSRACSFKIKIIGSSNYHVCICSQVVWKLVQYQFQFPLSGNKTALFNSILTSAQMNGRINITFCTYQADNDYGHNAEREKLYPFRYWIIYKLLPAIITKFSGVPFNCF